MKLYTLYIIQVRDFFSNLIYFNHGINSFWDMVINIVK